MPQEITIVMKNTNIRQFFDNLGGYLSVNFVKLMQDELL